MPPRNTTKDTARIKRPQKKRLAKKPQADPAYAGKDVATRFQPGNQMFLLKNLGRDHAYTDVQEFADNCASYFQWILNNPLYEAKPFSFQGASWIEKVPKMRVATIEGLCMHIGISPSTWKRWRADEAAAPTPVFRSIMELAESAIRDNKYTGAAAGLLNPMIIARDLGLSDRVEQDHKSTDGTMSPVAQAKFDPDDLAKLAMELADKL